MCVCVYVCVYMRTANTRSATVTRDEALEEMQGNIQTIRQGAAPYMNPKPRTINPETQPLNPKTHILNPKP